MSNGTAVSGFNAGSEDLADRLHLLVVNKNYVIGYTVMLLYDHVLTFSSEVEFIWKRLFTLPTYLFFVFRYATPLVCIVNLIAQHDPTWVGSRCSNWIWFPVAIGPVISIATGIILILRTYALFNRAYWVLYLTIPIYLAQIGVMVWSIPAGSVEILPAGSVGCIASQKPNTNNRLMASYSSAVVFDACIFFLTLARAVHFRISNTRLALISLLIRDGAMYFFALLVVNLLNVFLLLIAPPALSGPNARFSNLMTATLVARLMLNLRAASPSSASRSTSAPLEPRLTTIAELGNWIITGHGTTAGEGTYLETMLGLNDFDMSIGYEGIASTGTGTESSVTAFTPTSWHRHRRDLDDMELRTFESGRAGTRYGEYG